MQFIPLADRGLLSLSGEAVTEFLQGLVTNDVSAITDRRAIYAALLTPQGKYLHDFMIFRWNDAVFLDCEALRRDDLLRRLVRYRLRAPIEITDASDAFETFAVIGEDVPQQLGLALQEGSLAPIADGVAYIDPRRLALGARATFPSGRGAKVLRDAGAVETDRGSYDDLRLSLGVADGAPEIEPEKSFPMEFGLEALHGVSFTKGCYVGQEVTARMKSRGLVRKRLVPVTIEGDSPEIGAAVSIGSAAAGEVRAVAGTTGLALLRIDLLEQAITDGATFEADGARLSLRPLP